MSCAGCAVPGLGVRRHVWRKRSAVDSRTRNLHALLDKALAAGAAPVEVEADLVDLLEQAMRRKRRDDPTGR